MITENENGMISHSDIHYERNRKLRITFMAINILAMIIIPTLMFMLNVFLIYNKEKNKEFMLIFYTLMLNIIVFVFIAINLFIVIKLKYIIRYPLYDSNTQSNRRLNIIYILIYLSLSLAILVLHILYFFNICLINSGIICAINLSLFNISLFNIYFYFSYPIRD